MKQCTLFLLFILLFATVSGYATDFNKNQCPAQLVQETKGKLVVSGVEWNKAKRDGEMESVFKTVTIDPEKIKDVYYWSENFPPEWLAAHGMIAFIMEDMDGVVAEDGSKDIGIVLSVEAYLKEGQEYSLTQGLKKDGYHIVYQLVTFTGRIQKSVAIRDHSLDQFPLKLTKDQKVELLRHTIMESVKPRTDEMYHTLKNSCVSSACNVINHVLPKKKKMKLWIWKNRIPNLLVSYPKFTWRYMCRKKVADKKKRVKINRETEHMNFELASGGTYTIKISEMERSRTFHLVTLKDHLEDYFACVADLNDFSAAGKLDDAELDREYQQQISHLFTTMKNKQNLVVVEFNKNFMSNLKRYLSLKLDNALTQYLNKELLEQVEFMLMNNSDSVFLKKAAAQLSQGI